MKPVHLLPCSLLMASLVLGGVAWGQPGPTDAEPAALAPAPVPLPAAEAPPAADLPPPPPPRGSPPPAPQGPMVISAPPVPPPTERAGYHVHDGFYLRLAAGAGAGRVHVSSDSPKANDFTVGGTGLALNLWVGGTPWRGMSLGGLASLQGIGDSNTTVSGRETHEDMNAGFLYLGPFIDAFPDPLRGLHVGGSLGLLSFVAKAEGDALEKRELVKDYNAGGLGASAWIGYMGFVGGDWSLGGLLQLTALGVSRTEDDIKRQGSGYAVSLSFSALYH